MGSLLGAAIVCQLALADGGPHLCKFEGLHLCCKGCEKTVRDVLKEVKGVTAVACDRPARTVTFKAADDMAADEAVSALTNAGFHFKVTVDNKQIEISGNPTGIKADKVVIRNVHACCEDCEKAIRKLFKGAEVSFAGKGPHKDVTVAGKALDGDALLGQLQGAGLHGVIADNKK
jgi:copper chaperone CopZ